MSNERTVSEDRPAVDVSLLLVRVIVGVIFAAHGAQKLFGAFGAPGLAEVVKMMGPLGYPVTIGEFFGGPGLVVGFLCLLRRLAHRHHDRGHRHGPWQERLLS